MSDHLTQHFVLDHTLIIESLPNEIHLAGAMACRGEIVVMFDKYLQVLSDPVQDSANPWVVTRSYAYQAFVANHGGFLRHDNAHVHEGHTDRHHFHRTDWRTDQEIELCWCGEAGWPNLSEFVDTVASWYDVHCDELPNPQGSVDSLTVYTERLRLLEDE